MKEFPHSTASLAEEFGVAPKTIRKWAGALSIGINRDGNQGFLYTESDRQKLIASRRPVVIEKPRKKKRAA